MSNDTLVVEYQTFVPTTAIYPKANTGDKEELMYLSLGLSGEAGEIANKVKKLYRDYDSFEQRESIARELGDVMWYAFQLANALNVSMSGVLVANRDKIVDRQNRGMLGGSGDER